MSYAPTLVANNVLNRAFAEKCAVSPMKLQKILYFIASEYQKESKEPLFTENFETWEYGPVLRSVFYEFRPFSRNFISQFAKDADNHSRMVDEKEDPKLKRILERVWEVTRGRTAVDLSQITHMEGSAWDTAFQSRNPFLAPNDIESDDTYRRELRLASA